MHTDLLLITPGFPKNEDDSTCVPPLQVYLHALRKSRPELNIAVIATDYPYTPHPYEWHGIPVFPCNGRNRQWRMLITWSRVRKYVDQLVRHGPVKTLHSLWLGHAAMVGMQMAARTDARHVLTLMGRDARDGAAWWRRLKQKPISVCLSERHGAAFNAMSGSQPDAIIPWGIDPLAATNVSRDIDLLFVGSFSAVKRPMDFVMLAGGSSTDRIIRCAMVGDGPLRGDIQRAIGRLPSAQIELVGQVDRNEVLDRMHRSRVLVHTSEYESQGFVFDEALQCGMSIVSRTVGSARPMERWILADTHQSQLSAITDMLQRPRGVEPIILHPMKATADQYLRLYGIA